MRDFAKCKPVVLVGLAAAIAVLVVVGLAASHTRFERETVRAFQAHQLTIARSIAASVEEIIGEAEQDIGFLVELPHIDGATFGAQEQIEAFLKTHSDVLSCIRVTDAEGNIIRQAPASSMAMNISDWSGFAAARDAGEPRITAPAFCVVDEEVRVIRMLAPIYHEGGFGGVVYAGIKLEELWAKCLSRAEAGHESFYWVVDSRGEILYDTGGQHTGCKSEQVEHGRHGGRGKGTKEQGGEEALIPRLQRGEEGTAAFRSDHAGGIDWLIAFTPIRLGNETYGLAIITPKSEISGPIDAHARITYALMVGMLLFLCGAGYVGVRGARARGGLLAEQMHAAERDQAQEALQHHARLNQVFLDSLPPVAMLLRPKTREIVACNKAGNDVGAVPGKTCFETWGQRDTPCPWCLAPKLWATGEAQHLQPEGVGRIWDAHWIPVTKDLYLHYAYDITEAKRTEEEARAAHVATEEANVEMAERAKELQAARRASLNLAEDLDRARVSAEAANQSKSEFLANMSHEIRTPMTAILGFAENLLEPGQPESDRLNAIRTIRRNGDHLLRIINDILDISKIEAGKLEVERIPCSPIRVVTELKSLMQVRADAKNLPLLTEYIGAVPETIESDPTRLKQILMNLIGNAIKFTDEGEVRLLTRFVDADRTGNAGPAEPMMQFDVIDTGVGMNHEQIDMLFKSFSQADTSTTRRFGGTGLGLMISKRMAEMLGGTITVESQPGEGSLFRLTVTTGSLDGVKMLDDPTTVAIAQPEDITAATSGVPRLNCRILLAEDGPDNQRLVGHFLKKAGAEVTIVGNGKLAVDTVLAAMLGRRQDDPPHSFDVILMDMQMPVMDGYEATALLRQKGYTGPIIALTAHAMASDRQKCVDAGCDDYATKPIDRKKLIAVIQEWRQKRPIPEKKRASVPATHETADVIVS